ASGHMASFDRKKCKGPLNGPTIANGRHCPEGWRLDRCPGPQFENIKDEPGAVQSSYQMFVDQFDTVGLGKNVPMATGNMSDAIEALVDGKFVTLRVPYPMGFHAKGLDGRIDDPNAGWKGRGVWSTYAGRAPYHIEGGKGTTSKVVKFQLRPDPLAKRAQSIGAPLPLERSAVFCKCGAKQAADKAWEERKMKATTSLLPTVAAVAPRT